MRYLQILIKFRMHSETLLLMSVQNTQNRCLDQFSTYLQNSRRHYYIHSGGNIYEELNILANWFSANKLSLNVSKSKYVLLCRSRSP